MAKISESDRTEIFFLENTKNASEMNFCVNFSERAIGHEKQNQ